MLFDPGSDGWDASECMARIMSLAVSLIAHAKTEPSIVDKTSTGRTRQFVLLIRELEHYDVLSIVIGAGRPLGRWQVARRPLLSPTRSRTSYLGLPIREIMNII